MRLLLLAAIPAALTTSLAAQLTPAERQQREFEAVRYTIGETRQLEAERLQENYPLRGAACGAAYVADNGCGPARLQALSGSHSLISAMVAAGGRLARDHWVAFGIGVQSDRHLRTLGDRKLSLAADREATMTLASPIGGKGKGLMISTAVVDSAGASVWSRMGEVTGNEKGRYLVPLPHLDPGNYTLQVSVFDLKAPEEPYSATSNALTIQ